ncbi:MAG TPA: carbamoyltransferase C-terminal domain-containing protein [Longimicrobium sp.]|nr:carbamoyltransferase C-terminal domain-containing protein [Longimicrobium sp.]
MQTRHPVRILLFEGDAADGEPWTPAHATVLRADPPRDGHVAREVEQARRREGPIHVVACAALVPERLELATVGRARLVAVADGGEEGSVVVAPRGTGEAAFPASAPVVLSAGVCMREGEHSGAVPDLCIPREAAGSGDGAAVRAVAAAAARWCERLRGVGRQPASGLVRAALLAGARPCGNHLALSPAAPGDEPPTAFAHEDCRSGEWLAFDVVPDGAGPVCIAAVPRYLPHPGEWAVEAAEVEIRVAGTVARGARWARAEARPGGAPLRVEVRAEGAVRGISVAAAGARTCERRAARTRAKKPFTIVGISCSHDASACVVRDGRLECAIQLERLTRVKHDGRPYLGTRAAVDYCLAALNVPAHDVDLFAFNIQNLVPQQVGLSHPLVDDAFDLFDPFGERSVFVSHHLAHAFSAFFASPFDEAAVFVADGSGGSVIGADDLLLTGPELRAYVDRPVPTPRPGYHVQSVYAFGPGGYRLADREVARSFHPMCGSSSLGETYASVSQYVFGDWHEGGKLMGLAPYGSPGADGDALLARDGEGRLQFSSAWKLRHRRASERRPPMEHRHLAARVQRDLEEALVERVRALVERTGLREVAYAGGVALNSVANERILRQAGVRRLYVLPASHDAGVAIGAAAAAHFVATGRTRGAPVEHDYLGRPYTPADVARALREVEGSVRARPCETAAVAERLAAGQVVGWFEGGSEFGPRALGHRSILAAPFHRATWGHLNARIKFREEFRPYAPVVPVEQAGEWFDMGPDPASPYMLRVVPVREHARERLGAVTHVDGTARVQTVDARVAPRLHALLRAFGERTGVPVLVNTSMNVRGQPIVETPAQALEMLLCTFMDALVLGDTLVEPRPAPAWGVEGQLLARAPTVEMEAGTRGGVAYWRLVCGARGGAAVELPPSSFLLLSHADGRTPVAALLDRFAAGPGEREGALELIRRLAADRLLLLREPGLPEGANY